MKSILFFSIALSLPVFSYGNTHQVDLRCTAGSMETCMQKTQDELANQNCGMIKDSLRCENSSEDKSAIYCSARTERCGDVSSDGFLGVTCNGEKVKIKDRKLSATWSKGIFSTWVREMCIMKAN